MRVSVATLKGAEFLSWKGHLRILMRVSVLNIVKTKKGLVRERWS